MPIRGFLATKQFELWQERFQVVFLSHFLTKSRKILLSYFAKFHIYHACKFFRQSSRFCHSFN